jgi:riboflavin kinase/FMN adenylyltransferase
MKVCHNHGAMRIITTADFSRPFAERSVVSIGNFDGVHRGHREIFRRIHQYAHAEAATSVAVTFDPHPLQIIHPSRAPLLITSAAQKRALIAESDLDLLVVIPFTSSFASVSAERFVREILVAGLGMRHLVIGHDYAFGRGREGNERLLSRLADELGFVLEVLEPVGEGELIFSSSEVRRLVQAGEVAAVVPMLGRCHRISGRVIHGREIGRSLGFPTANIITDNLLIPADGVYAVWVEALGELHMGACSIGSNPTFDGGGRTIEAFLFDFNAPLYGQEIALQFVARLRGVTRFPDVGALKEQISRDVTAARALLAAGLPLRQTP